MKTFLLRSTFLLALVAMTQAMPRIGWYTATKNIGGRILAETGLDDHTDGTTSNLFNALLDFFKTIYRCDDNRYRSRECYGDDSNPHRLETREAHPKFVTRRPERRNRTRTPSPPDYSDDV